MSQALRADARTTSRLPRPTRALAAMVLAALMALAGGCGGGAELRGRSQTVDSLVATARENGAERCAPVELALAESHVAFAKQDLDEGDPFRARRELEIAESNAREALRLSPKDPCVPPEVVAVDSDGDGIFDDRDACKGAPEDKDGFEDEDGCPDLDNDQDGIVDASDACPLEPEDKDGLDDEDGCPEEDRDGDMIADNKDQCPDEPEDKDGFADEDGCPDCDNDGDGVPECPVVVDQCPSKAAKTPDGCPVYNLVKVTSKKIEIKQTIYFETGKNTIKPVSFALLNEVATVLTDNPEIEVRIEGHTDSRGSAEFNMELSQSRAESVRSFLIDKGVDGDRLEAKGYGESAPIANNNTRAGQAQNRRVEFVIVSR
ncbi:OmpA family protein [Haliangium ochraceum]|uniref:OmpA/MotB domain protein n=1 Tax=Haliangium ochraceum (strain DSM 14365 / JCM 11303 / SMP-2) TaxID=502025 RepID=D0LJF8_HALO1|nr:OmpA family protein [Haliangium ochraceum]ACY16532.1 OmpA/MotB domain protein [Haliangium ochraceum DSM 14365]